MVPLLVDESLKVMLLYEMISLWYEARWCRCHRAEGRCLRLEGIVWIFLFWRVWRRSEIVGEGCLGMGEGDDLERSEWSN